MPDASEPRPIPVALRALADRIDACLPQTQCTKCGFDGCRPYALAIALGTAPINRCPPGGAAGIAQLAALTAQPIVALDPACGREGPLRTAWIDESRCIGCTLCIQACPVDAIVGSARKMHTVLAAQCTGCDLCLPPCPVDCIEMRPFDPPRRWEAVDAAAARARYEARRHRLLRERVEIEERRVRRAVARLDEIEVRADLDADAVAKRKARVAAAIERARERRRQHAEALARAAAGDAAALGEPR